MGLSEPMLVQAIKYDFICARGVVAEVDSYGPLEYANAIAFARREVKLFTYAVTMLKWQFSRGKMILLLNDIAWSTKTAHVIP